MNLKIAIAAALAVILSILIVPMSGSLTAPRPATPTANLSGELNYIAFHGGALAGELERENFEAYLAQHQNLTGKFESFDLYSAPVPRDIHEVLNRANPPDVMSGFVGGVLTEYIQQGKLADLSDLWRAQGWDRVFPKSLKDASSYNGKQYFVPMAIQWNPIWYRKNIFEELQLSIPTTWEELLSACERIAEAGYIPLAISVEGWNPPVARWFTILNLRLNGAQFHEELMRGKVSYTDPRVRAVFEHWAEMFERNCFAEDSAQSTYPVALRQFMFGQAAMYNLGEWLFESIPSQFNPAFDFFSLPTLNENVERAEIVHLYGAYMLSDTKNRAAAEDFLAYRGSVETQELHWIRLHRLVGNREVKQRYFSETYLKGLDFVTESKQMAPLFEFNTEPSVAELGLESFVAFWNDPSEIDSILNALEEGRQKAFNP